MNIDLDVQIMKRGGNVPVYVDASLSTREGWRGGQWVMYTSNTYDTFKNVRVVGISDGTKAAGFILRGSNFHPSVQSPGGSDLRNSEYNYSSYQPLNNKLATMCLNGSYIFKIYEKYVYPDRASGTEIEYNFNDFLYISENGLLTTRDDALSAGIVTPIYVGVCWLKPSDDNNYSIGIDVNYA